MSSDTTAATEQTRAIATAFIHAFPTNDEAVLKRVLSPNVRMWILGSYWWSGEKTLEQCKAVRDEFISMFAGGLASIKFSVKSILADGQGASAEIELEGPWRDGRTYRNHLHVALDVRDGMVVGYREYFDTAADLEFFGQVAAR